MKEFNLEEFKKNPSQKVVTRDGREVRIICTDRKFIMSLENFKTKSLPIVALVFEKNLKSEGLFCYYEDGKQSYNLKTSHDLFFAPTKREGWINIYKDIDVKEYYLTGIIYDSEEDAKETIKGDPEFIATIKIEWEE